MNYIWNNARAYNEDSSEISKMAGALEVGQGYSFPRFQNSNGTSSRLILKGVLQKQRQLYPSLPSQKSLLGCRLKSLILQK